MDEALVSTLTFAGVGKTVIASFDYKRFKQRYTREVFRMFDNEEPQKVTLICANEVMKGVLDKFGMDITVKKSDPEHFRTQVKVCTSPTFFSWVFQWGGRIRIEGPEDVLTEYREMARKA